jgi:uncharacterized Tic20 family protein
MSAFCNNCGAAANGAAFCANCGSSIGVTANTYQAPGNTYQPANSSNSTAMWAHIGGLLTSFIVPLIIRSTETARRDRYVRDQSTEALNFQLQWIILSVGLSLAIFILSIPTLGIALLLFVPLSFLPILIIIFGIMASVAASRGENYRYPMMFFRLVK